MKITYKAALRGGRVSFYKVKADGEAVGTVTKNPVSGLWYVYPYASAIKPPYLPFPSRKAAAEWLVAASGLWLVNP